MLNVIDVSLQFGGRKLFDDVNIKFSEGNCYGVIGANGAGKSTFLKILSKEIDPDTGKIILDAKKRLSVLNQNHFEFDEYDVLTTVLQGHKELIEIMKEKDYIYSKPDLDFESEDGMRVAELEERFAELDGWEAESNAGKFLVGLNIPKDKHSKLMKELTAEQKVKVLLAQALFGNPDVLILDEPTNHLDIKAVMWFEEFLLNFENTVIVVSHDRHFLNKVCTHMADVDFGKIRLTPGNYDFWYQSSQLALQLMKNQNKKTEEKAKDLRDFIARFGSNASKARQATSRKKLLEKLTIEDIKPSSRRYPFVGFSPDRDAGNNMLTVEGLTKSVNGEKVLDNITFSINPGDKTVFISRDERAKSLLFQILMGEVEVDSGSFTWGVTTSRNYYPKDNANFFDGSQENLVEWLRQYSPKDQTETFLRGFLGRMLFSGDEVFKKVSVLSGGEKVRCMFSKLMLSGANVLVLDEPTNHLDLESITAVNNGLSAFKGTILLIENDHEFIQTVCNRVIELTPKGAVNRESSYDEFISDEELQSKLEEMYA
ncbi:MAG: ATP-binding cassette domain-containing protein [Fusobacteria bacterium]|nr:ATP-binding cassette domain-containing protein [Fusobacteriota bacterium]